MCSLVYRVSRFICSTFPNNHGSWKIKKKIQRWSARSKFIFPKYFLRIQWGEQSVNFTFDEFDPIFMRIISNGKTYFRTGFTEKTLWEPFVYIYILILFIFYKINVYLNSLYITKKVSLPTFAKTSFQGEQHYVFICKNNF